MNEKSVAQFLSGKTFKIITTIAILVIIILTCNPITIIGASSRGVRLFLGAAGNETLQPGLQLHAPLVGKIQTYSIEPRQVDIKIPVGTNGAISKDNQTLGFVGTVFWTFDEARIPEIAKGYSEAGLRQIINDNVIVSLKTIIGNYSIFDIANQQDEINKRAFAYLTEKALQYPVKITQLNISNWDWSEQFDAQIEETMKISQQVRKAEQELLVVEQETQRQIKEANARRDAQITLAEGEKRKIELEAEARLIAAQKDAESKIAEGQGIAEYNRLVATNQAIEVRLRELEIQKIRAEKWDGREIPETVPFGVDIQGTLSQMSR
jgi:regulator of protease activity HflC (stomatin/prohibitin superfamily)